MLVYIFYLLHSNYHILWKKIFWIIKRMQQIDTVIKLCMRCQLNFKCSDWCKIIMKGTKSKTFASNVTDKELVSKIYKQLMTIASKQTTHSKWAEDLNRHFSKEDIQMTNMHMKRCQHRYFYRNANQNYIISQWSEWLLSKNPQTNARRCGEKRTLLRCWWNVNWYSHYGEQFGGFIKE